MQSLSSGTSCESFPSAVRGTGAAIVVGIGPIQSVFAGYGATTVLGAGRTVMFARKARSAEEVDQGEITAVARPALP